MHTLAFVLIKRSDEDDEYTDSRIEETLQNEGFATSGYFSSGYCDWFEIGGRWSESVNCVYQTGSTIWEVIHKLTKVDDNKREDLSEEEKTSYLETVRILHKSYSTPTNIYPFTKRFHRDLRKHFGNQEVFFFEDGYPSDQTTMDNIPLKWIDEHTLIAPIDYHN
jgi:hypothetical protein